MTSRTRFLQSKISYFFGTHFSARIGSVNNVGFVLPFASTDIGRWGTIPNESSGGVILLDPAVSLSVLTANDKLIGSQSVLYEIVILLKIRLSRA